MKEPDQSRRNLLIGGSLVGVMAVGGLLPSMYALRQIATQKVMPMSKAPKRPEGHAKPILDEDITPILAHLDKWYSAHLPSDKYVFNAPATEPQIDAFERLVGFTMPRSYRQLYRWHDGENDDRYGHIYGLPVLPLERAAGDWKVWKKTLAGFGGDRYAIPSASCAQPPP